MADESQPSAPSPVATRSLSWLIGMVLWSSFLAACAASLFFFAAVDPLQLRDSGPRIFDSLDREAGYGLGLLFFWGIGTCASGLTLYLARTLRSPP
jgi:hypothetical protein